MAANIQNGCHSAKIGQNLPTHVRKLQFEVVVLIDCMFYAYNVEGCIQIWNFNTSRTKEKKMAANKFKMVATEFK